MRRVVTTPYFAASARTCSISDGWALSPSISIAMGRDSELMALLYPKPQRAVALDVAHHSASLLRWGVAPSLTPPPRKIPGRAAPCHLPLPPIPTIPYATLMSTHACAPATPPAPSVQQPTTMVAVDTGDDAARPAQAEGAGPAQPRCGCRACPAAWRLFHPPSPAARIVPVPGPRLFPGCFARHSFRSCAARLEPAFALQPPSCAALLPPPPRFESKLRQAPLRFNSDSTSKLHRAFSDPGETFPGTGPAGKKRAERNETNRMVPPLPMPRGLGSGLS